MIEQNAQCSLLLRAEGWASCTIPGRTPSSVPEWTRRTRATVLALAEATGLSRNTVQARLAGLESRGVLRSFERRIDPAALGHPLRAFVQVRVTQRRLDAVAAALAEVPEVVEVLGMSGEMDLLVQVVARDADDLYRVAGALLAIDGVERTTTSLVMRRLVEHRLDPLLRTITEAR